MSTRLAERTNNGRTKQVNKYNRKMKPITYEYADNSGSSFFVIIDKLTLVSNEVSNFFIRIDNAHPDLGSNGTPDDYFYCIFEEALKSACPQLQAKENIHSAFSISVNKVTVRLEPGVAFEIENAYEIIDGFACITKTIGRITMYVYNGDLVQNLENEGFTEVKRPTKRTTHHETDQSAATVKVDGNISADTVYEDGDISAETVDTNDVKVDVITENSENGVALSDEDE
jgi:hypothetical protein